MANKDPAESFLKNSSGLPGFKEDYVLNKSNFITYSSQKIHRAANCIKMMLCSELSIIKIKSNQRISALWSFIIQLKCCSFTLRTLRQHVFNALLLFPR